GRENTWELGARLELDRRARSSGPRATSAFLSSRLQCVSWKTSTNSTPKYPPPKKKTFFQDNILRIRFSVFGRFVLRLPDGRLGMRAEIKSTVLNMEEVEDGRNVASALQIEEDASIRAQATNYKR
ncbi:hypothetical protein ACHAXN_002557, partial [Cyclotella atomus]